MFKVSSVYFFIFIELQPDPEPPSNFRSDSTKKKSRLRNTGSAIILDIFLFCNVNSIIHLMIGKTAFMANNLIQDEKSSGIILW